MKLFIVILIFLFIFYLIINLSINTDDRVTIFCKSPAYAAPYGYVYYERQVYEKMNFDDYIETCIRRRRFSQ